MAPTHRLTGSAATEAGNGRTQAGVSRESAAMNELSRQTCLSDFNRSSTDNGDENTTQPEWEDHTPVPDLSDLYTVTPNGNAGGAYGAARRRPHFPMEHASRFYFQDLLLPT